MKDSVLCVYGKLNGKRIERHDNGKLQEVSNWKNGVEDGEHIEFYDNGNIRNKYFVKNGILNGENTDYWENGKLKSKVKVTYGKTEKPYYGYNDDGSKFEYFTIYNGIFNGVDTEFDDKGKSINSLTFWKNDKVLMSYVRIFISDDYARCKATKYEYLDGLPKVNNTDTTTTSSEISLEYKNNKYNKYYMDLGKKSSYDKIYISDNDNWHMEDFQILLNAIEYKKRYFKTKNKE